MFPLAIFAEALQKVQISYFSLAILSGHTPKRGFLREIAFFGGAARFGEGAVAESGGWDGEAAAFAFVFRIPPWPGRSKNPENKKRSESQPRAQREPVSPVIRAPITETGSRS
ncbi:hypothetical protein [Paenibacillus cymbidii]|uniref:hypothetical protein n=1 Tax=Paenibacillus cymbidii TaxID=1639034 RepID=UPI0010822E16|nr:hypothetical protein [Paenibacillus cymbidii]